MLTGGIIVFIALLELAQRDIPTRCCDPWDVFWGGAGVISGGLLINALRFGWRFYSQRQ